MANQVLLDFKVSEENVEKLELKELKVIVVSSVFRVYLVLL